MKRNMFLNLMGIFACLLWAPSAFSVTVSDYLPLTSGYSWTYQEVGYGSFTQTVQPGTFTINGTATKLLQNTYGGKVYLTNDSNGIREHQEYFPDLTDTPFTLTFNPPFKFAEVEMNVGQSVSSSGTVQADVSGVGTFTVNYSGTSTLQATETVIVPKGTFDALKVYSTIIGTGYVGSDYVRMTLTRTFWVAKNWGIVKQAIHAEIVAGTDVQTADETDLLTATNFTPLPSTHDLYDFSGDGKADILWQHTSSGTVVIWVMNGTSIASVGVPGAIDSSWQIKGVGDFNGDGKADILWQHTSGTVALWLMNGTTIGSVGIPGAIDSSWQIKGVGDFDGDGKADILWQHTSGTVAVWLMNGTAIASVGIPGAIDSSWQIKAVGDFNSDGRADILWQHTSGTVAVWLMNGTAIGSVGIPGAIDSSWQIKGVGDFNGDGKADILWQHTSGTVALWVMNGTSISSVGIPGAVGDPNWKIVK